VDCDQLYGTELLAAIASGMVALQKQYAGKGPTKCQAHWAGSDTLVVMMGGGFTQAEQTMYEGGRGGNVRDARLAFQDTMRERMTQLVEDLVARRVVAFMSATHQQPDLAAELFVFEPLDPDHPVRAQDQRTPVDETGSG
jgi:uncharacterized protein YbcI